MLYESLLQLVGGYLHEDWFDDYPTTWDAVDAFVKNKPAVAPSLVEEINQLLVTAADDAEVQAVLTRMSLSYHVYADGYASYGEWLFAVARRVEAMLSGPHPRSA